MAAAAVAAYELGALESVVEDDPSAMVPLSAVTPGSGGGNMFEDLMRFRRWSIFLPAAASSEVEQNTVYVRGRHSGNPKFFEQTRERLAAVVHDRDILRTVGQSTALALDGSFDSDESVYQALEHVMQAQWTALGFASDRQFYKAFQLGSQCTAIVDALAASAAAAAASGENGENSFLFWQLLVRANLGGAHARFGKQAEATAILRQALRLAEDGAALTSARERVLLGAIYSHLVRVCLELRDLDEAQRLAELAIEAYERNLWELSDALEDRETQALVLATSYMTRGVCDVRKRRFDTSQTWLVRALETLEKHNADLGPDGSELRALITEQANHCKSLQL
eukprot:TRINITY_DN9487_c0_g1_i1.p1 TRINITY_DN9487_c0_g1~~TRINITY_DN9487_c0_g1_i1.p1  ORF type:complete len:340 (+),score=45.44 TRINITY_DN9487_c0_g1_i1:103-1122(+)